MKYLLCLFLWLAVSTDNYSPPFPITVSVENSSPELIRSCRMAFREWESVCDVKFVLVNYNMPSMVRIRTYNGNTKYYGTNLGGHGRGLIYLNRVDYFTILHELGHVLDLVDCDDPFSIMNYRVHPNKPGPEDIREVQRLWGKSNK